MRERDDGATRSRPLTAPAIRLPAMTTIAEGATDAVGAATIMIGAALVLSPRRTDTALGLGYQPARARAVGLVDLALGPGLLAGRPRWPWMAARATLNLVIASHYRAHAWVNPDLRRARTGAAAMTVLTVVDGAVAVTLLTSRR